MPFHEFTDAGGSLTLWRLFVLAILVLLLKRIPIIIALWKWIPDIKTFRESIFCGHFGPIGVGAIFIATLGRTELPEEVPNPPETSNDVLALTIQPIVFFFVLCSITVHGLTIPFFAFSRRAHTITRTWSKHASFSNADGPDWMNRVRRFRSQEVEEPKEGEGEMSEIRRVLDSQLGIIGKGAIGGDAEKELRREETTTGSGSGSGDSATAAATDQEKTGFYNSPDIGLINTRTERDLERAANEIEDPEDYEDEEYDADPASEWAGEDTCELRRYKAAMLQKKEENEARQRRRKQMEEESSRRSREEEGQDISDAPMDRDLHSGAIREEDEDAYVRRDNRDDEEQGLDRRSKEQEREALAISRCGGGDDSSGYPRTRSWVEGHKLIIEHLESRSDDPKVEIINLDQLTEEDRESISSAESPALAWVHANMDSLKHYVSENEHESWGVRDAATHLIRLGIPSRWETSKQKARGRTNSKAQVPTEDETSLERNDRAALLFGGMDESSKRRESTPDSQEDRSTSFNNPFGPSPSHSTQTMSSNASSERSRSPPGTPGSSPRRKSTSKAPLVHTRPSATSMGGRRQSMRQRVLAGQLGLSGRKAGSNQAQGEEEEMVDEAETPSNSIDSSPQQDKSHQRQSSISFLGVDTSHDHSAPTPISSRPGSRSASPSRAGNSGGGRGSRLRDRKLSNASLSASKESHPMSGGNAGTGNNVEPVVLSQSKSRDDESSGKSRGRGGRITSLLTSLTSSTGGSHSNRNSNNSANPELAQASPLSTPQRTQFSPSQTPSSIPSIAVSGASESIFKVPGTEQDDSNPNTPIGTSGRVMIDLPSDGPPVLTGWKKGDEER